MLVWRPLAVLVPKALCEALLPMKTLFIVVMVLVSASLAQDARQQQPSSAQSFVPAPGQTFSLDLDTAAGTYSNWWHHDLGSLSALRATIRIPVIREDAKWTPAFSLWVHKSESGQVPDRVGIQFVELNQKLPLAIRVVQFQAEKAILTELFLKAININENVNVEIVWAAPNIVTIKIGDSETHTLSVPWSIGSVEVAASTGEMKVDPLVLGTEVIQTSSASSLGAPETVRDE